MIKRLHRTFEELEHLPSEAQEEIATHIEALLAERQRERHSLPDRRSALDVIGAWSDVPWEQLEEELDRIRHESAPTPPIDAL